MMTTPLSRHRSHDVWAFTSGQIARAADGAIPAEFGAQMRAAMESLRRHLDAADASLDTVTKTTVFLTRERDLAEMNDIYASYFGQPWPARSIIVVGMARPGLLFEIEAVAQRRRG